MTWKYFETLNFIWLDAAQRAPQDSMKRFLEVSSLIRENSEKHQKTTFLLPNFSKIIDKLRSSSKLNSSYNRFLLEKIMDLQVKIHALLDYAIKIEKANPPPAAMFDGLAERLLINRTNLRICRLSKVLYDCF